jgi:hypothetical protein
MDKDTFIKEIYNKCGREEIESFLIGNGICYVRNNFIDKIYNNTYDTKFNYFIFIANDFIDLYQLKNFYVDSFYDNFEEISEYIYAVSLDLLGLEKKIKFISFSNKFFL